MVYNITVKYFFIETIKGIKKWIFNSICIIGILYIVCSQDSVKIDRYNLIGTLYANGLKNLSIKKKKIYDLVIFPNFFFLTSCAQCC